jgi:hypothetical protein
LHINAQQVTFPSPYALRHTSQRELGGEPEDDCLEVVSRLSWADDMGPYRYNDRLGGLLDVRLVISARAWQRGLAGKSVTRRRETKVSSWKFANVIVRIVK